jgi:thiamine transporter ThiT
MNLDMKKSMYTAVCLALCVVLVQLFHTIPNAGNIYCPIHIPVFICAFICGTPYACLTGLMGPVLSMLFTGMPSAVMLPGMIIECMSYGLVTGFLYKVIKTGSESFDLYISLIISMIVGRVAAGLINAIFYSGGDYSIKIWMTTYFLTSAPGIVLHLILVPLLVKTIDRVIIKSQKSVGKEQKKGREV